jgi:hypothetical protein
MFATARTSKLAQRTLGALRLTRSFLLLEDDYDVDWEVDRDEELTQNHPHRVPLRGPGRRSRRAIDRRRGEVASAQQLCLSPVESAADPQVTRTARTRPCAQPRRSRSRH